MSRAKIVSYVIGLIVLSILVGRLPDGILRSTQAFLYVTAATITITVTAAMVLLPARRLLVELFSLPLRVPEEGTFGLPAPDEATTVARPLMIAAAAVGVALLAGIVR